MILSNSKKLSTPKKLGYILILFLLIIFVITYFFMFSAIQDITKLSRDIISQKVDLENKIANEKNLISLNEKVSKIEPQIEKFDQIFINQNRDLEFITTLEGIAEKNNINQKIIFDPSTGVAEQEYKKVLLSFELSSDYANFLKYLDDLEALPYYINIFKIDVSSGKTSFNQTNDNYAKPNININITMSADTYWK